MPAKISITLCVNQAKGIEPVLAGVYSEGWWAELRVKLVESSVGSQRGGGWLDPFVNNLALVGTGEV